jgi:hypothetical protein
VRARQPWLPLLNATLALAAASALAQGGLDDATLGSPTVAAVQHAPAGIRVIVEAPGQGATIKAKEDVVEVRGTAIAAGEEAQRFDVMVVLDVSGSTKYPSGADVDGDGLVGENPQEGLYAEGEFPPDVLCTDPEDTILHAEIAAARALVRSLDPRRTRAGLVTFSGDVDPATHRMRSRDQKNADLQVPLTPDFARIESGLSSVLARGPHGATDFSAGIRLATTELAGLTGAVSQPGAGQKVMLFLTDGTPSFPIGLDNVEDAGDLEAAVNAARIAKEAGIRINTYALGTNALGRPVAATEVARVTLGSFTPVAEPGAIVAALQSVNFANVEDVAVVNLTLREDTPDVRLNPDGTFQAFVPVRAGANRVLVNAVASDGSVANVELAFSFEVAQSEGAMRERELAELRRLNTELLRHVEAERVKRERRKVRVQKEIDIRVQD